MTDRGGDLATNKGGGNKRGVKVDPADAGEWWYYYPFEHKAKWNAKTKKSPWIYEKRHVTEKGKGGRPKRGYGTIPEERWKNQSGKDKPRRADVAWGDDAYTPMFRKGTRESAV